MSDPETRRAITGYETGGDTAINPTDNPTMGDIITARFSRRELMRGALAVTAISATLGPQALNSAAAANTGAPSFDFTEISAGVDATHHVAAGYDADILLRWGDPLFADTPAFDPKAQSADKQRRQFGYNSDYVGYLPIDGSSSHGLLMVNHEYTNKELMFAGIADDDLDKMTREMVEIEIAAHGGAVVEIRRDGDAGDGKWMPVLASRYNRRITADTPMAITGPAAGDR